MALSRGRAWLVAGVATLAMSVSYVDRQVLAAIGSSVRTALQIDAEHFGWLAAAFSAAYLIAAPIAGALVDALGARRGLAAAIVAWSAVAALHALAPTFGALFMLRLLLGLAEAPSFPAAAQCVRRALPAGDRSAAFGMLFTGSSFGAAIAAPLAIGLDHRYGYKVAFVIAAVLGMAWLPAWIAVTYPRSVRDTLASPDDGASAVPVEHVSHFALLRDPAVLRALVLVFASAPGLMFMFVWMPQYLELAIGRGIPKVLLPHYVWLPPVMADLGMVSFGYLASRLDRRATTPQSHVTLVALAAVMAASMALAPLAVGPWATVALLGFAAAGCGGMYTLLTADMMSRIDPARVSTAGGLTAGAQSLVYVVLNPIVGRWIDKSHSFDGPLVLLGLVALPGALAWSLISPNPTPLAPRPASRAGGT